MRWTMALFSLITCTAGSTLVIGFQQQYIDQDTNVFENCKNAKPPVMSDWNSQLHFADIFKLTELVSSQFQVYVNMDNSESAVRNPDVKNSFLPATSHFLLILIEHCILVFCIFNPDEKFLSQYKHSHAVTMTYVPFILWFGAAAAMIIYYRFFNKAQIFQNRLGPEFSCCCDVTWYPFKINKFCSCSPRCNPCSYVGLVCCTVRPVDNCDSCECPEESLSLTDKQTNREEIHSNGTNGLEMVRHSNGKNGTNGLELIQPKKEVNGANGLGAVEQKMEKNGTAVRFNRDVDEAIVTSSETKV